jgi:hypothetical protein
MGIWAKLGAYPYIPVKGSTPVGSNLACNYYAKVEVTDSVNLSQAYYDKLRSEKVLWCWSFCLSLSQH